MSETTCYVVYFNVLRGNTSRGRRTIVSLMVIYDDNASYLGYLVLLHRLNIKESVCLIAVFKDIMLTGFMTCI